jgi:hypothetical protein
MSLHNLLAHEVRSKGRGDDTMLIHMTPQEVGGLQALAMAHGGSLSINPDTGLPEAGFLKSILPTLIGVGLSFIPGVNALGAGLITGGIQTARTGDLGQGILAGLGAFGGAGLGSSLAGASSVGADAAGQAAMQNAATQQALDPGFTQSLADAAINPDLFAQAPGFDMSAITGAKDAAITNFANQGLGSQLKGSLATLAEPGGLSNFGSSYVNAMGGPTQAIYGGIGLASPFIPPPPKMKYEDPEDPYANYEGPYTPTKRDVRFPTTPEELASSREYTYFSPSNPVPFAQGGLTAFAKGRFLEGPGDGTSDSIPGVLHARDGGMQPARLADGEFVIDARTVSEIGNGSSKAGAKKLYAMMDRVHNERKKASRGKDSNADKYLPA